MRLIYLSAPGFTIAIYSIGAAIVVCLGFLSISFHRNAKIVGVCVFVYLFREIKIQINERLFPPNFPNCSTKTE